MNRDYEEDFVIPVLLSGCFIEKAAGMKLNGKTKSGFILISGFQFYA